LLHKRQKDEEKRQTGRLIPKRQIRSRETDEEKGQTGRLRAKRQIKSRKTKESRETDKEKRDR